MERLRCRRRQIEQRLAAGGQERPGPVLGGMGGGNIDYEVAGRARGIACGGIGAIQLLVLSVGLAAEIDRDLELLKAHKPYHESDHVLSLAYNILCGGTCIEDLELLRTDEALLDALGADRIPDPTTAGDFCRRFKEADIQGLMGAINRCRLRVWARQAEQDRSFLRRAILDVDGTIAPTCGACKQGMDMSYDGQWSYHPLIVSLANTKEPLFLVNRSGNRPSHEGAAEYLDQAAILCREAGFKSILFRGDGDFSQTGELDRWDADGINFLFGLDAMPNLKQLAGQVPESAWQKLQRPARYEVQTEPRSKPADVKEGIVKARGYRNIRVKSESVAEFDYQPVACKRLYRVVVLRKHLSIEQGKEGERVVSEEFRYLFYITNLRLEAAHEVVLLANDRCDQENLIEQMKNGAKAMRMPCHDLESNWAYMVIASLAWTLKAWFALTLPAERGPWQERHREQKRLLLSMEFKRFANALIRVPCQIVKAGRRVVYRLLSVNAWSSVLLRAAEHLHQALPHPHRPMRC
jgi:hypothetical protein